MNFSRIRSFFGDAPKGIFHAFWQMKIEFSVLFQTLFDHEKLQNWSVWHGYSDKKKKALEGLCRALLHLGVSRYYPRFLCRSIRNGS